MESRLQTGVLECVCELVKSHTMVGQVINSFLLGLLIPDYVSSRPRALPVTSFSPLSAQICSGSHEGSQTARLIICF